MSSELVLQEKVSRLESEIESLKVLLSGTQAIGQLVTLLEFQCKQLYETLGHKQDKIEAELEKEKMMEHNKGHDKRICDLEDDRKKILYSIVGAYGLFIWDILKGLR